MFRRLLPSRDNCEHNRGETHESQGTHIAKQATKRRPTTWNSLTKSISSSKPSIQIAERVASNKSSIMAIHLSIGSNKPPVTNQHENTEQRDYGVLRSTKTHWELGRRKTSVKPKKQRPVNQFSAHAFHRLPREVYDCIIAQLEQIHLGQDQACPSCYLRDLYNLSLTSRAWDKATTSKMYHRAIVLANEDHPGLPTLKIRGAGRLKLLRRTLLEQNALARCVRELDLSDFQMLYQNATIDRESIINLVASLVMACPQLERLIGFHIPYTHSFDRLSHALSTRPNLKERMWLFAEPDVEVQEDDAYNMKSCYNEAYDPTECFLELNSNQKMLTTLVLHQDHGQISSPLNFRAVIGTIRQSPLLENLSISGLGATSFTNMTLNSLPPNLRSLRLENLPGINEKGLQRFFTSPLAVSIENLKLINLEIKSLVTIANIFSSHLANLRCFALVQYRAPGISPQTSIPDFNSSVRQIHWEIRSQGGPPPSIRSKWSFSISETTSSELPSFPFTNTEPLPCLATSFLAASIQDGAFPFLEGIRIPHDPQGLIQALCKPLACALLPSDAQRFASPPRTANSAASSTLPDALVPPSFKPESPRADSAMGCMLFPAHFSQHPLTPMQSRLAAQHRILAARNESVSAAQTDDSENDEAIESFIGQVDSKIVYQLKPDHGCTAERGVEDDEEEGSYWIVGIEDVTGQREIANMRRRARRACNHSIGGRAGMNAVGIGNMY